MALSRWAGSAAEVRRLLRGYPRWIVASANSDAPRSLPVFVFHTLDPNDFEAKLSYLRRNGYESLRLGDAVDRLERGSPVPDRSVVLTIDDGRLSAWSVGLPLLRRYGFVASLFVVPGYVEEGPPRSTLEEVRTGAVPAREVVLPEREDRRTPLRWSELEALHASGLVDVQSHTMLHRQVVASPRLAGFLTPEWLDGAPYEVPLPPEERRGWTRGALEKALGAPLFRSRPILGLSEALEVPAGVAEACVRRVREAGGAAFFRRPGWRLRLHRTCHAALRGREWKRVPLEPHQKWELTASRRLLEERLAAASVRHLCLPRGCGTPATARLAAACGYRSVLWGFLPGVEPQRPPGGALCLGRLKHDYIFRLPGEGRRSLGEILGGKAARRLRGETGY